MVAKLTAMGKTASEIAAQLGGIVSINAIRDKQRRLGIRPVVPPAWSEERVALLKELCAAGLSYGTIGAKLGVSRCAIIGKTARLGIDNGVHHRSPKPRKRIKINTGKGRAFRGDVSVVEDQALPSELSAADIPVEQRKTLLELENHHCRFPYGDVGEPGFFFCGAAADVSAGRPYCEFHFRLCHTVSHGPRPARKYILRKLTFTKLVLNPAASLDPDERGQAA